jgi:hypothetical protein
VEQVKPTKINVTAELWRNGSDGEPQLTVQLPNGAPAWGRIPRSSTKAYAACVDALNAEESK